MNVIITIKVYVVYYDDMEYCSDGRVAKQFFFTVTCVYAGNTPVIV